MVGLAIELSGPVSSGVVDARGAAYLDDEATTYSAMNRMLGIPGRSVQSSGERGFVRWRSHRVNRQACEEVVVRK